MTKTKRDKDLELFHHEFLKLPKFNFDPNDLDDLKEWLARNEITKYSIIELYSFILFYEERDAIIYSIGYNK